MKLKRCRFMFLLVCSFFLCACGSREMTIDGEAVEVIPDDDGKGSSFVIRTDDGEEIGVLIDDDTVIVSYADDRAFEEFRNGSLTAFTATAYCKRRKFSLERGDSSEIDAYRATEIGITSYLTGDSEKLSDGTALDVWKDSDSTMYRLKDGMELLKVQNPSGPEGVYAGGTESFDDLSEKAQAGIQTYYDGQGLLYDVQEELEKAYACFRKSLEENEEFCIWTVSQDVAPTASSEKIICFETTVTIPDDDGSGSEYCQGAVFDRETGEYMDTWELFTCGKKEAIKEILDMAGITEEPLRSEMTASMDAKNMVLFDEGIEVYFPRGPLKSQEELYILGLDYDDRLLGILQEWAVPRIIE